MAKTAKHSRNSKTIKATKPSLAHGGAVHASIRNRWQSERPFSGHSDRSLLRKLQSGAVLGYTKDLIYKELERRNVLLIDIVTGKPEQNHFSKLEAIYGR